MFEENKTCDIDGCSNKLREVTHRYDNSLSESMKEIKIYPFDDNGKLYPIKGGYVKADNTKGNSVEQEETESNICYVLKDTSNAEIGTIEKGKPCPVCDGVSPTPGFI
jgi:hypothetical protein